MIVFKHLIVLLLSIGYGFSLSYITNISNNTNKCKIIADLFLTAACLTSVDFMSYVFNIGSWLEKLCYVLMACIVILPPLIRKMIKKFRK